MRIQALVLSVLLAGSMAVGVCCESLAQTTEPSLTHSIQRDVGPVIQNVPETLSGQWHVEWVGVCKSRYSGTFYVNAFSDNTVSGTIAWTLDSSERDDLAPLVGSTGAEYVKGKFDPKSRVLIMQGYYKEDPREILGLDQYQLILSNHHPILAGFTRNSGNEHGRFWGEKQ